MAACRVGPDRYAIGVLDARDEMRRDGDALIGENAIGRGQLEQRDTARTERERGDARQA